MKSIFPVLGKWQRRAVVPDFLQLDKKIAKDSWFRTVETVLGASEMQSTALSRVSLPCMKAVPQIAKEILVGTF